MRRGVRQLPLMLFVGLFVACSSFGSGDGAPPEAPDASTNPPVGGAARGEVVLAIAPALALVHGKTLALDVTITRVPPFTAGMTLTVRGLPSGIGATPVDVSPTDSTAKLDLVVAQAAAQGPLTGASLEARSGTAVLAEIPLAGFVQGSSGELDTTFGTKGIVALDNDANQLAIREDGAFYVLEQVGPLAVRKYTKDGVLDTTFGGGTGLYLSGPATPMSTIAWKAPHLFLAGGVEGPSPSWYVRRLDGDGKLDATYGVGGTHVAATVAPNAVRTIGIGPGGEAIVAGSRDGLGGVFWLTSTGAAENGPAPAGVVFPITQVIHEGTRTVGIGPTSTTVINSSTHKLDATFGYAGYGPTVKMTSIARDGVGKFVLGGLENDKDLIVARLLPTGFADTTFASGGVLRTALVTNGGGGYVAATGDKVVQVGTVLDGTVYRCLITRYTSTGASDTTFGQAGKSVPLVDECYAGQIAAQPDGRLVISGKKLLRLWP